MADPVQLRIYLRYEVLYPGDFRAILQSIESAYNRVANFSGMRNRSSVQNHLRIDSINTGNSIITFLSGNAETLLLLALVIHYVLKERHDYWQTEKTKWEAKLAERKFRERADEVEKQITDGMKNEDPNLVRAVKSLEQLVTRISRSRRIVSLDIRISAEEQERDKPKRAIRLDDEV